MQLNESKAINVVKNLFIVNVFDLCTCLQM